MQNTTFDLDEGRWSVAQLSRLALILAFSVPILAVALGTAIGTHVEYLGGAMIAFWAFAALSLGLATIVANKTAEARRLEHRRWAMIVAAIIAVGPVLKAAPAVLHSTHGVVPFEGQERRTHSGQTEGCLPELVSSDTNPVSSSKSGHSGNLAWLFWIGNYYEWQLNVSIAANNAGAYGTASAVGTMSSWYSLRTEERTAIANAQGNIDCVPDTTGCTCFAQSTRQTKGDGDFTAKVTVSRTMTNGGADLEVTSTAAVAGAPSPEITVGAEGAGVKLPVPNTAIDSVDESKSYSYRCLHVRP